MIHKVQLLVQTEIPALILTLAAWALTVPIFVAPLLEATAALIILPAVGVDMSAMISMMDA